MISYAKRKNDNFGAGLLLLPLLVVLLLFLGRFFHDSLKDWGADYEPFGATRNLITKGTDTGPVVQNMRLPGQYADAESGFNQNGFRDYMPAWGRYLQSDPIGLRGGMNTYGYANANPVKWVDRNGTNPGLLLLMLGEFLLDEGGISLGLDAMFGTEIAAGAGAGVGAAAAEREASRVEAVAINTEADIAGASCPVGRRGNPIKVVGGNSNPTNIDGIDYTAHALDQMQGRGVPPSVVQNTINNGIRSSSYGNTTAYTDPSNGVEVIVNQSGGVVTVKSIPRN